MKKFTQIQRFIKINEQSEVKTVDKSIDIKITPQKEIVSSSPVSFFSKLLESREMAQVYHWTVKGDMGSHAAHLALQSYYEGIIEFIDNLVEIYQGQYELLEGYDIINTEPTKSKDKIEYFSEIADFVKSERFKSLSQEDTHMQNIVDEILALIYKTLYRLKYNK